MCVSFTFYYSKKTSNECNGDESHHKSKRLHSQRRMLRIITFSFFGLLLNEKAVRLVIYSQSNTRTKYLMEFLSGPNRVNRPQEEYTNGTEFKRGKQCRLPYSYLVWFGCSKAKQHVCATAEQ